MLINSEYYLLSTHFSLKNDLTSVPPHSSIGQEEERGERKEKEEEGGKLEEEEKGKGRCCSLSRMKTDERTDKVSI